jgi:hypothetical protein
MFYSPGVGKKGALAPFFLGLAHLWALVGGRGADFDLRKITQVFDIAHFF